MNKSSIVKENYQYRISCLRIAATVSVIWLHTCSTLAENPDDFSMTDAQSNFFSAGYQMMYWAVPIFFMVTGRLLLDPEKTISAQDCWKKYAKRIFLALVIFGIPFAALKIIGETGNLSVSLIPLSIRAMFENKGLAHLWYLYSLIGIYLILPVLRLFVKYANTAEVRLVLAALLVIDFFLPVLNSIAGTSIAFELPLKYPVLYVLLGWYLKGIGDSSKKILSRVSVVVLVAVIWVLNYTMDDAVELTGYNSPLIVALALAVYVSFETIERKPTNQKMLWSIDRLCFGTYLVHPVFIQFAYRFIKLTPLQFKMYAPAAAGFFLLFAIAGFGSSWVMSKIPPLRKYVL